MHGENYYLFMSYDYSSSKIKRVDKNIEWSFI